MKNIFTPFAKFFKIDFNERLNRTVELDLYQAKLDFIKATQNKQYWDANLKYHVGRVEALVELASKMKGSEDAENSSITTINVSPR